MLFFLPSFISFPITFVLFCLNLTLCGSVIFVGGLLKFIIPIKAFHRFLFYPMNAIYRTWAYINYLLMVTFNRIEWQITGDQNLSKDNWYLLIANHQSWLDIFVLSNFARTRIPAPKYFLKDSLKKVPFIGMACWALDMPFMKRYSRTFLKKHPHLKGKDIETTKASCQKFKDRPTTIINFVEGTRFTKEKQQKQANNYTHLLTPKASGIAFTMEVMGEQFDKILNVTLLYPNNPGHVMKDLLKGNLTKIIIDVEAIDNKGELLGDYSSDVEHKKKFNRWLSQLWQDKDNKIKTLL